MQLQTNVMPKSLLVPHAPVGEEARVDAVLAAIEKHIGFIPDGVRLFSFSPPLLDSFVTNVSYFNSGARLAPSLMAMIRYLVSWEAQCHFCINMNEGFLTNMGVSLDAVRAARKNPELAPIPEKEKPLLMLALKSVNDPAGVAKKDIELAKAQGWTDRDVFDVVAQAASNRAFNLILRTFKVESQGAFM
ncbi:MAG: hypothetical protein AABY83_09335 [Pseudomonadota bacterium]